MKFRPLLTLVLSGLLVITTTPVQAGMIGTPALLGEEARTTQIAEIQGFLAREDVRRQMQSLGVDPATGNQRVAAMTDSELQQVSRHISTLPAGADDANLLAIIVLVLLLMELLGITHIFNHD